MKPHHCPKKSFKRRSAEPEAGTRAGSQSEEESLKMKTSNGVAGAGLAERLGKRLTTRGKGGGVGEIRVIFALPAAPRRALL